MARRASLLLDKVVTVKYISLLVICHVLLNVKRTSCSLENANHEASQQAGSRGEGKLQPTVPVVTRTGQSLVLLVGLERESGFSKTQDQRRRVLPETSSGTIIYLIE